MKLIARLAAGFGAGPAFAYHDRDGDADVTGDVTVEDGLGAGLCLRYVLYALPAK